MIAVIFCVTAIMMGCTQNDEDVVNEMKPQDEDEALGLEDTIEEDEFVVCIDAGHGFDDVGCDTEWLLGTEAEVNLDVVEMLQDELESLGVTTILTHDGNTFPSAQYIRDKAAEYNIWYDETRIIDNNIYSAYERSIYALILHRETPIDFFVSLHVNSSPDHPELSQYELYYYEGNVDVPLLQNFSESLADKLDNISLIRAKGPDDAYTVTRYAEFPSILVEMGYATNEHDVEKINSLIWRRDFCEILANEIYNIQFIPAV